MDNEFGMHDDELEDIIEKPISRVKVNTISVHFSSFVCVPSLEIAGLGLGLHKSIKSSKLILTQTKNILLCNPFKLFNALFFFI